jgi:hypothetical protein
VRACSSLPHVVDESDSDQILTIEELRSLRDRMGTEAAAPPAVMRAPEHEVSSPPAAIPVQARADPWEDLRRRASDRRRWTRPLAAAGCLALVGGAVSVLVVVARGRTDAPSVPRVSPSVLAVPAVSAPAATASAPVTVSSAPEPSPEPSALLPPPSVPAPSQPADETIAATVPAPRATQRPKPPPAAASTAARRSPTGAVRDGQPHGTGAARAGTTSPQPAAPCTTGCAEPTLTRTPTSWNPTAPP